MYFSPPFLYICLVTNQKIKVMKKLTVKQQLVDMMIAAGNPGFTYTDVIKTVLKINFGRNRGYNYKIDRGYYACAISGINNYFMNGSGKCGLYKQDGKYYAKYFTAAERKMRAYNHLQRSINYQKQYSYFGYDAAGAAERFTRAVARFTKNYERSLRMIEKQSI